MDQSEAQARIVAVDGPAASGKSSVSRELARRLSWPWVSTGAFYRGLAYMALQNQVSLTDEQALQQLAESATWSVELGAERTRVWSQGQHVTEDIYREDVGSAASQISQFPSVRSSLLQAQRNCARNVEGLIAEGRDCGTVVFPHADVKIYLTAHSESRAQRRALEHGESVSSTEAAQYQRDQQDTTRKAAPLQIAANAHVVDTSTLTLEEVVDRVEKIVRHELGL